MTKGICLVHRIFLAFLLALALVTASVPRAEAAATARAVKKTIEHSLRLDGTVAVTAEGQVEDVVLKDAGRIPPGVEAFVQDAVRRWQFEPARDAEGHAFSVRAPMSLRLVAGQAEDGGHVVSIRGASFTEYDPDDLSSVAYLDMVVPRYPDRAVRARIEGDAYMGVKVGRDGRVEDVATRQVNLHAYGTERVMEKWRGLLAAAAAKAIREWTFRVPTEGPLAGESYWQVMVPIAFRLRESPDESSGSATLLWTTYVPGPKHQLPWEDPSGPSDSSSPDVLAEGGVYMRHDVRPRIRLLTPLGER
ncbi:protein tonB [Denitratimonas tolerans]|uniref:Protein tonB n=1 Tax=Denitratimonas tolerans TaxID=1338420 RepID=A0AAW9R5I1_9GAMM|nr:protein tonB [Xanthomonadaceae bacterium]HRO87076.1 protein tonB [Chiayiivirga sp.]